MRSVARTADHYQRGASKFGIVITLLVVGLFFPVRMKIVPVYMDHNLISSVAQAMLESGRTDSMMQAEVRREFANSLSVNNIRDFDASAVTSSRANNKSEITLIYEKRVPLFHNINAVISFNEKFE
jgi:hypothetical protein